MGKILHGKERFFMFLSLLRMERPYFYNATKGIKRLTTDERMHGSNTRTSERPGATE